MNLELLDGKIDLAKGIIKTNIVKYGDLLTSLYERVKKGGALETTDKEKGALYKLANNYQKTNNITEGPINEQDFTKIVRNLNKNVALRQMIQWGGSNDIKPSKRLRPLYKEYCRYYRSSQLSTVSN